MAETTINFLEVTFKAAMIVIAGTNVYFAQKFFYHKNNKEDIDKEKDRKINWLKTLILDHNLKHYYTFFDDLETELNKLKVPNLSIKDKETIDENNAELFVCIRRKFIDILLVVDKQIYDKIQKLFDKLQEELTEVIFNQGINLNHQPKFDEEILSKLSSTKTDVIKEIFKYRG
jgi:hypothetical protein